MKRKAKLKIPRRLLPHISKEELEMVRESEALDRIVPKPEPKRQLRSPDFSNAAADKAFLSSDDPNYRGALLISELANCLPLREFALDRAASLMRSLKPRTSLEVLLCSQMIAIHAGALNALGQAANTESLESADLWTARANRLCRTFVMQIEALQSLRSKGKQRITVKHVNVNLGGQAIMGSVTALPGGVEKNAQ